MRKSVMASVLFVAILACILPSVVSEDYPLKCNFNPTYCNCTQSSSKTEYESAKCAPGSMKFPKFTGDPATYTIYNRLDMVFSAYNIPDAMAFAPFKQINFLSLTQPTFIDRYLQWNNNAFHGSQIKAIAVTNVANVLPPPNQLHDQADNLEALHFINCGTANLRANTFSKFGKLKQLQIQESALTLNDDSFNGLENLGELWLLKTDLDTFPTNALKGLTNLFRIDLTDSNVKHFTKDDFVPFSQLVFLTLDGNDVQAAIDSGALLNISETVNTLFLQSSSPPLKAVPASVIANAPHISTLSLSNNAIDGIRHGDFPGGNGIMRLDLSKNPITVIESEAMQNLSKVFNLDLVDTKLQSFDFSLLHGMAALQTLDLSRNSKLIWLNVSDIDVVPHSFQLINVSNTPIQFIDPELNEIIAQKKFQTFDLSNVETLVCDESIAWMAKYVLCPPTRIYAPNANCTNFNHTSIFDYLSTVEPNACDVPTTAAPTSPAPSTTAAPTSTAPPATTTIPPSSTKGASAITSNVVIMIALGAALALLKSI